MRDSLVEFHEVAENTCLEQCATDAAAWLDDPTGKDGLTFDNRLIAPEPSVRRCRREVEIERAGPFESWP